MKTINNLKLGIIILFVAATMVSCNQPAKKNHTGNAGIDSTEVMGLNRAKTDETKVRWNREMERLRMRLDSLDENDPEFNTRLRVQLERFDAELDNLDHKMQEEGHEMDREMKTWRDSLKAKNNELRNKLKRWTNKTGENLEELGNDIKREFRELKESLKSDNK